MKPNLVASMILALTLASVPAFSKDPKTEVPHLTVRVLDYVSLPAGTRGELEGSAKRILINAGITIDFIECYTGGVGTGGEACTGPLGPSDLILRIFQPKAAVKREQLGYAAMTPEGGACITVFVNPSEQRARVGNLSNGAYLGHAVAHEVGHLLLGPNSHSSAGIMRPVWRPVDEEWMVKRALLFNTGQAHKMQSSLVARLRQ